MNNKYDLAIAYRIYPGVSKEPPVFADNKLKLSELCLYSFKRSLGELKVKLFAVLDNCPDIYVRLFEKYFSNDDLEIIRLNGIGNAATFKKQIDLLLSQNHSDLVYLAEDDYFYYDNEFEEMLNLLLNNKDINFITPYFHPDYINMNIHKQFHPETIKTNRHNWKSIPTTTLTFLTKKEDLLNSSLVWETYLKKNSDASMWLSLTKHKIKNPFLILKFLFSDKLWFKIFVKSWLFNKKQIFLGKKFKLFYPEPSIATHMDKLYLAPGMDQRNTFDYIISKINFVK